MLYDDIDSLAASILMSEMSGFRGTELLRAFAVLVRTFLSSAPRHPEAGADFCDTTHCQVFRGLPPDPQCRAAVRDTAGTLIAFRGRPFRPFYSTRCGGTTATYREVWGADAPDYPFPAVDCPPCRTAPAAESSWNASLTLDQIDRVAGFAVSRVETADDGSVLLLSRETRQKWTPENFRVLIGRQLGWNLLRSNRFTVRNCPGSAVCFEGTGRGHRVGLCQYGASAFAVKGWTYRQILSHYFPGTELLLADR